MPLELTVSMLVLFAALQSGVQAFRVRHEIHWRELAHILLFIIIGMPIGFFSLQYLPELALKGVLGIFVAFTAIKGLIENHRGKAKTTFHERPWHKLLLVCSGIISGAFGCGGPLTVIYTRNRYRDKQMFRVMQFGCGTFSMGLTCLAHVFAGSYTMARLPYMIVGLAAVLVALRLSTWLVQRIYAADTNTNVLPSMHVIGCAALTLACFDSEPLRRRHLQWVMLPLGLVISMSTVFVKQHSILDVFVAIPVCVILYFIIYHRAFVKKFRKAANRDA